MQNTEYVRLGAPPLWHHSDVQRLSWTKMHISQKCQNRTDCMWTGMWTDCMWSGQIAACGQDRLHVFRTDCMWTDMWTDCMWSGQIAACGQDRLLDR